MGTDIVLSLPVSLLFLLQSALNLILLLVASCLLLVLRFAFLVINFHHNQNLITCNVIASVAKQSFVILLSSYYFLLSFYLSRSAKTKSIAPSIASRSGIVYPLVINGNICICGKDGVLILDRYEDVPPSLIR